MKVKFLFEQRSYPLSQIEPITDYFKFWKDVKVVTSDNYDLLVGHHAVLSDEQLKYPVIVIERADSSCLTDSRLRGVLDRDNVLGVIKSTVVKSIGAMNCGNRYHYTLIDSNVPKMFPEISSYGFSKIKCLMPLTMQNLFRTPCNNAIDFKKPRHYDFCYIASRLSETAAIHRKQFFLRASAFGKNKVVSERPIERSEWLNLLKNTKVCISPWGYGEMCYRDFDAIYCGCVLLKPFSDFLYSYPNIYDAKYYISCKPDGSDLVTKVNEILENWDSYLGIREVSRTILTSFWNYPLRAKDLEEYIKTVYENYSLNH